MLTLSEYLETSSITQQAFAAKVGISKSFLNDIVKGRRAPALGVALRIQRASGHKVSLQSLEVASQSRGSSAPAGQGGGEQ